MAESRFIVGVDLGTTNSVLAFLDPRAGELDPDAPAMQVMPVPQLVKPGEVAARDRLPSFLYLPAAGEFCPAGLELPWGRAECVVGELARGRGAEVPARVVASASEELPPLEATLAAPGEEGRTVPVRLRAHVTELGTLELWCVARDGRRRWKVEFNVRQAG
jgi:hypothetical protein